MFQLIIYFIALFIACFARCASTALHTNKLLVTLWAAISTLCVLVIHYASLS